VRPVIWRGSPDSAIRTAKRATSAPDWTKSLHKAAPDAMVSPGEAPMSDGPDSPVLRFMRQVDAKLDRVIGDLKIRVSNAEENLAALNRRADRMDLRLERIERRLDPTEIGP
jgi:hypothetical protein